MLDLAKLNEGAMQLEQIPFNLAQEIDGVAGARSLLAGDNNPALLLALFHPSSLCNSPPRPCAALVTSSSFAKSEDDLITAAPTAHWHLALDYSPNMPSLVVGDALRLKQVAARAGRQLGRHRWRRRCC